MMIYDDYLFYILYIFVLFIQIKASIKSYKFEHHFGSNVIFPPCLSAESSLIDSTTTTILFKSDSGELLSMNGKLISNNPRLMVKNHHSSQLVIQAIESSDEGQYECRTNQTINYIAHLLVINSSTIRLTAMEGSNVTLQCAEKGMWIIEESHRGGPVRTQYTTELILDHIQRNDNRFRTIVCSTHDGHEKREYIVEVMYKPSVTLVMTSKRRLMCIICAHPLPQRVQWYWNTRKGRDDDIQQTKINQSCIAQQFTFGLNEEYTVQQIIICEAENIYGIDRDTLQLGKGESTTKNEIYLEQKLLSTSSSEMISTTIALNSASLSLISNFVFIINTFVLHYCLLN